MILLFGHYKYNYEESTTEKGNVKTTKKVFTNEQLIGEKYERLKNYLTIITNGKGLLPTGMFTWPIPNYTNITSHFRNENTSNQSVHINYILGTDVGAPIRS